MKLPNKIFGIDTEEAYKRYIEGSSKTNKEPESIVTPTFLDIPNLESYIILPGRKHGNYSYPDLAVAIEKSHNNKNWQEAHEALQNEQSFMLTIRQYADLLQLLSSGKAYNAAGKQLDKQRLDAILDEILTARDPWRGEWLDAYFSKKGKQMYIAYHNFDANGKLVKLEEQLEDCLMDDCNVSLASFNRQGLPTKRGNDFYYWHPRGGYVARFGTGSGRADLNCIWLPVSSDPQLGVRAAKLK